MTRRVTNVLLILMLTSEELFDDVDDWSGISPGWGTRLHPVYCGPFTEGSPILADARMPLRILVRSIRNNLRVLMNGQGGVNTEATFRYHLPSEEKLFRNVHMFSQRFFCLEIGGVETPYPSLCVNDSFQRELLA
jgi:hypothetical protein